jgi:hypothetical protein
MRKDITLKIDIEVNTDKHLIRSNVPNSYNAVGYIDIKVSLGNIRINVPIKTLWGIIKNLNMQDEFRKDTTKHISKLKKDLEIKSKDKILAKKDCFSAVTFSYYETGCHFCVVVGSKEGLDNIEEYWNKFLDKEWR